MKKINKIKIVKSLMIIITLAIMAILIKNIIPIFKYLKEPGGQEFFKNKIQNLGFKGFIFILWLEIIQIVFMFLPGEPVELLAGVCYGPVYGTIFLLVSIFITSGIIVFFVKKYGVEFLNEFILEEKIKKYKENKLFNDEKKIELIIILLYIIPGTPKDLFIYIGGLLPINPLKFLIITTILRFPSIISSTVAGKYMIEGNYKITVMAYSISIIFSLIIILIINIFDKNKKTKKILDTIK